MQRTMLSLLFFGLLAGCAGKEPEEVPGCPRGFYEVAEWDHGPECVLDMLMVGGMVASIAEGDDYLQPVNREPFVQQHGPEKMRTVYGSTQAMVEVAGATLTPIDLYRTIDPEDLEGTFDHELPVGTVFVHYAVVDGPPYGAMVKQAEGTDPDNNDWFFGRFDEYGYPQPLQSYDGQTCRDCHLLDDRPERTDMLWGVPRASL